MITDNITVNDIIDKIYPVLKDNFGYVPLNKARNVCEQIHKMIHSEDINAQSQLFNLSYDMHNGNPRVYKIKFEELENFILTDASAGDIAMAYDPVRDRNYVYICNSQNIGQNAPSYPAWTLLDEEYLLKKEFKNMSLEDKVDFLIHDYIMRRK